MIIFNDIKLVKFVGICPYQLLSDNMLSDNEGFRCQGKEMLDTEA